MLVRAVAMGLRIWVHDWAPRKGGRLRVVEQFRMVVLRRGLVKSVAGQQGQLVGTEG